MNERAISTISQALALVDEWEAAYADLQREYNKLQDKYEFLLDGYETRGELLEHFEKLVWAMQRDEETVA